MPTLPRSRADVLAARRSSGLDIVAVVPARNEAATVGQVVRGLVDLVDADLLTEVVVVDGRSDDGTAEQAADAGARVIEQATRPQLLPAGHGKGDALWQGVGGTSGDVVLFVDGDVRGFTPDFVVPLLAPLLCDPRRQLVKAAYRRPFGGTGDPTGGGRVTTLLARPLLAVLWPELGFLDQPLAGEYAGRRTLLESLPFVQGYGVELALLLDTLDRHGPEAITQVDLGVREHGHQTLEELGTMAAEILAVALGRAAEQGRGRNGTHGFTVSQRPPWSG